MKAVRKYVRISPKKVNVVAGLVRNKKVKTALAELKFLNKKPAQEVYKAVKSASANAVNNFAQKEEELVIKSLLIVPGPTLKRINPVSRGRARRILKRTSHIFVEVGI